MKAMKSSLYMIFTSGDARAWPLFIAKLAQIAIVYMIQWTNVYFVKKKKKNIDYLFSEQMITLQL